MRIPAGEFEIAWRRGDFVQAVRADYVTGCGSGWRACGGTAALKNVRYVFRFDFEKTISPSFFINKDQRVIFINRM